MIRQYCIQNWTNGDCPHPKAALDSQAGDYEKPAYFIDLSSEEIVTLSETHDVMIQGARKVNAGTKKKPSFIDVPAMIWLDVKGSYFRTR